MLYHKPDDESRAAVKTHLLKRVPGSGPARVGLFFCGRNHCVPIASLLLLKQR